MGGGVAICELLIPFMRVFTSCICVWSVVLIFFYFVFLPQQVPLHQNVRDLVNHILPKLIEAFGEDDEK